MLFGRVCLKHGSWGDLKLGVVVLLNEEDLSFSLSEHQVASWLLYLQAPAASRYLSFAYWSTVTPEPWR